MVSTQTKMIVAFLVSTLVNINCLVVKVSLMVWDLGSMKKESETKHKAYDMPDEYRVLHRSKRQLVGNQLNVVYRQFETLQSCCAVPALMPSDALQSCQPVKNKAQRRKLNGWFNNINSFYMPNNAAPRPQAVNVRPGRGKRQAAEKIALSSVCFTDCAYAYLNFLNDSALDLVSIEDMFVSKMRSQEWKQVVQDALYTCEEPAACATPSEITMNNRYCSIKPTILMNCMRKQMILNCPSQSRSRDFKCNSQINSLKGTNVMSLG